MLNPLLDRLPSKNCPPSKQSKTLSALCKELGYSDVWRALNPLRTEFTFYSPPHKCYSRIDYFFVPSAILQYVSRCAIINTVVSDHAVVLLDLLVEGAPKRTKHWRFNMSLLKDNKFISYFNSEFKIFWSINSESIDDPSLLWETCKAYIRGLAISYSITKKRKQVEKQERLELELKRATEDHVNDASPANLEKLTIIRACLDALLSHRPTLKYFFQSKDCMSTAINLISICLIY